MSFTLASPVAINLDAVNDADITSCLSVSRDHVEDTGGLILLSATGQESRGRVYIRSTGLYMEVLGCDSFPLLMTMHQLGTRDSALSRVLSPCRYEGRVSGYDAFDCVCEEATCDYISIFIQLNTIREASATLCMVDALFYSV